MRVNLQRTIMSKTLLVTAIVGMLACSCSSTASSTQTSTSTTEPSSTDVEVTTTTPTFIQAAPGDVTLSIAVDKSNLSPGDTFIVSVMESTNIPSRGAQCALSFDPSAVTCNKVVEGNFYSTWAQNNSCQTLTFPSSPSIDNTSGTVSAFGVAIMGQDPNQAKTGVPGGATGQGVFCTFEMTVKPNMSKTITFTLTNVDVLSNDAREIQGVAVVNGSATIGQ